jgi:hypothetical protein
MTWRWTETLAVGIALCVSIALGVSTMMILEALPVGAGYVAKNMCSCVFVSRRSLESCRPDMLVIMSGVVIEISDLPPRRGVRASISPFATRFASYDEPYGCTLE